MRMPPQPFTDQTLRVENAELRARLEEAEEMLRAIRAGEVDALIVESAAGPQVFTLQGLDAQQSRLRGEILAKVIDAVISVDTEDRVTFLNAAAEHQYGICASDMLGREIAEMRTQSGQSTDAEAAMQTALRERGEWRGELIHRTRAGREMYVELTVTGLFDPDGAGTGWVTVVRDISERRQAEAALRGANQRFEVALKCSQVVLFQQDLELRYTWLQNGVLGFEDSYAVGKRDADLMERAADAALTEALKREVIRSGVSQRQDVLVHFEGVGRLYDLLVEPQLDAAGLISGVTCAAIDITERQRAEQARHESERDYRALALASSEVAYRMSADWSTMLPLDGRQLVASSDQPLADWMWLDQNLPPDEHRRVRQAITEAIARKGLFELEHRVRHPDGSIGWTLSRAVPILDESKEVLAWFGAASDITSRKAAEDALRDSTLMLADLDRRKDAFLATLSHELRNPLGVIGSSLHLLRLMGHDRDAVQQGCERMQRQVVLLTRLIDDLMDVSRIKQDKLTLQTERLDLAAVAQRALENSRTVLDQRGHTVTVVLPPQPITVDGDATRLAQVVGNLLTNAAKYSEPGSPIGLTVEQQGDVAVVAVRDRGIGIAPGDLRRVFELFAQVSGAAHLAQGGLGIGLNLVQRVVELHGGSVEARSDGLGHGSEFLVRLPLVSAVARTESPPDLGVLSPPPSRRYRILVADDNEDAVTALAIILSQLGHDVRTAKDGAQAVAVATIFQPEVALLDIGMPELDGHEACRRIRALPGGDTMVLVAVSGWGQVEDKRRAQNAGFQHHFVKPVDPAALTALMHSLAST